MPPTFNLPADALARLRMLAEQQNQKQKPQTPEDSKDNSDLARNEKKKLGE